MDGGGRAGQGVVFVDVDPQGVLPDDGAGHGAGPGDDHPGVALGGPAAARAGQLYQVSRVAVTRRGNFSITISSQEGQEDQDRGSHQDTAYVLGGLAGDLR